MKEGVTFAPAYVAFYPHLAQIARNCGYSLCIHGSVGAGSRQRLRSSGRALD